MDVFVFNNKKVTLAFEEEIRRKEPEFFIMHVAGMRRYSTLCGRTLTAADKIAHSLTYVTALYAEATKRVRGGWTCGTHINHVRTTLSHTISSKYSAEEILRFIDFCVGCSEGRDFLQYADKDIKDMEEDFLSMRPEPFVHPPASWCRRVLEDED